MCESEDTRHQELARAMLAKARRDQTAARTLAADPGVADEVVGFHVQQALEKSLKAILAREGVPFAFTHDLSVLLTAVTDVGLTAPVAQDDIDAYTPFAVAFRYADLDREATVDRDAALRLLDVFIDWTSRIVESPPKP
jgi:HEPN domain-containing protein